ncbi:putative calcium permease family membrane transporter [Diplodia seriata]|uniref:Putative calcium permease family membrane transporter n=1 Tax=Diplodia seriata TaxID=420778 RepID=A0A0G2GWZ8_9PEZI|nr:putative calcium permease family membrane transporter [Diplodia seriata]
MGRRTTSYNRLHRGQEFSVDDAEDEVDELFQPKPARASGSLRRVPSTLRRRPAAQTPNLGKVDSTDDEDAGQESNPDLRAPADLQPAGSSGDDTIRADEEEEEVELDPGDDDADLSDAESFTLKDRQEAINETHPFGIRIWKPALYKKNRSVQKTAEGDIHSTPGGFVSPWLVLFNFLWTLIFGWWLAAIAAAGALICFLLGCADGSMAYGRTFWGLAKYLFYPFGKFVKFIQEEAYLEEDEGEGRSISEYEQWQSGDIEEGRLFFGPSSNRGLVGRRRNSIDSADETQSLLGRPSRGSNAGSDHGANTKRRLFGRGKWTVGRVVFFIVFYGLLTPSLFLVSGICWLLVFTIPMGRVTYLLFDHLRRHPLALSFHSDINDTRRTDEPSSSILLCTYRAVGIKYWKYTIDGTNIFLINLLGVVAFVIFDYWVLVEYLGLDIALTNQFLLFTLALFSIIPLAYFIGQAVASISAQSSMGVGATINAFFSTVVEVFLYCVALKQGKAQLVEGSIIGSIFAGVLFLPGLSMCFGALKRKTQRFNVRSAGVTSTMLLFAVIAAFGPTLFYQIYGSQDNERDCRRCYFDQSPAIHDRFYLEAVRPFVWFASVTLFLSYAVGLLFTLRTHAAVIWNSEMDEKKMEKMDMAATQLAASGQLHSQQVSSGVSAGDHVPSYGTLGKSDQNIRDSALYKRILGQSLKQAEILVNTVDAVLENVEIDEKFLGITLFALVPNTTEFLNAISFAMNGNIALSMEIGSAYALQVCLLQIPALVLYSAIEGRFIDPENVLGHTFTLIFPQWDMVTVILCVFLLSYMYGEGKSNYFKGSILILSYLVVIVGFYFSGYTDDDTMGINRFDTLALGGNPQFSQTFKTVGRGGAGRAY